MAEDNAKHRGIFDMLEEACQKYHAQVNRRVKLSSFLVSLEYELQRILGAVPPSVWVSDVPLIRDRLDLTTKLLRSEIKKVQEILKGEEEADRLAGVGAEAEAETDGQEAIQTTED